jgi:hypothetical protein
MLFSLHICNGAAYSKKEGITDYEKASDRVPRGKLWNIMNKGFPDHILKTVQSLCSNTRIKTDKRPLVGNNTVTCQPIVGLCNRGYATLSKHQPVKMISMKTR